MGEIGRQFRPFCFSISPILVSKMGRFALQKDFNQKRLLARKDCNSLFVVLLPDIFYFLVAILSVFPTHRSPLHFRFNITLFDVFRFVKRK